MNAPHFAVTALAVRKRRAVGRARYAQRWADSKSTEGK